MERFTPVVYQKTRDQGEKVRISGMKHFNNFFNSKRMKLSEVVSQPELTRSDEVWYNKIRRSVVQQDQDRVDLPNCEEVGESYEYFIDVFIHDNIN